MISVARNCRTAGASTEPTEIADHLRYRRELVVDATIGAQLRTKSIDTRWDSVTVTDRSATTSVTFDPNLDKVLDVEDGTPPDRCVA